MNANRWQWAHQGVLLSVVTLLLAEQIDVDPNLSKLEPKQKRVDNGAPVRFWAKVYAKVSTAFL